MNMNMKVLYRPLMLTSSYLSMECNTVATDRVHTLKRLQAEVKGESYVFFSIFWFGTFFSAEPLPVNAF